MKKTKTTKPTVTLKDGQYYTAIVNRKKIRGKVWNDYNSGVFLCNNQGVGIEACDFDDECEFNYGLEIYPGDNDCFTKESLKEADVSTFTPVTDKRIKKVIDRDILPVTAGYRVRKNSRGNYEFGCGEVEFSPTQIKNFLIYEKKRRELSKLKEFSDWDDIKSEYESRISDNIEECDLDEVEQLLKY